MPSQPTPITSHPPTPSARILSDRFRLPIEQLVSIHTGQPWQAQTFQDLIERASHHCGILSDGQVAVFVKVSDAANGLDQFEVEMAGLHFLAAQAAVQTPTPIGIIALEEAAILVLESAPEIERGAPEWRAIGRTLAQIHSVKGPYFGFDQQGYFGPTFQDNRPMPDWISFFTERRLWPNLAAAINAGQMPTAAIRNVEKLIARLPGLDIPLCQPCLLHGDAQQNNYISTAAGAIVIDPAIFYGIPEFDLAQLETFQHVPQDVFDGYQDVLPIAPGFDERRELWRVPCYLLCVAIEGASYMDQLNHAVEKYL